MNEQHWQLGLRGPTLNGIQTYPDVVFIGSTRSRLRVFRWLRSMRDDNYTPVARESWTVGGNFDGEEYAGTKWEGAEALTKEVGE